MVKANNESMQNLRVLFVVHFKQHFTTVTAQIPTAEIYSFCKNKVLKVLL